MKEKKYSSSSWSRILVRIKNNTAIIILIHWIYNEKCQTNNNHELLIIPVPCCVQTSLLAVAFDASAVEAKTKTWLHC